MIVLESLRCPASPIARPRLCLGTRLELRRGDVLHVQGENGAGKTTLLRILAGLELNYSGTRDVPRDTRLLTIPTNLMELLLPWYSVDRNTEVLLAGCSSPTKARDSLQGLMASLLPSVHQVIGSRPAYTLSAGQKAAMACAWALATTPDVLLLDETLSYFAATLRERVIAFLTAFVTRGGILVYVDHHEYSGLASTQRAYLHATDVEQQT